MYNIIIYTIIIIGTLIWLTAIPKTKGSTIAFIIFLITVPFIRLMPVPNFETDWIKKLTLVCQYVLAILLVGVPVNVGFQLFIQESKMEEQPQNGRIIGFLERGVMVILLQLNSIAAIGLVFTAKTLTRFDRITKEQHFAETYLVGTLYSIFLALVVHGYVFYYIILFR